MFLENRKVTRVACGREVEKRSGAAGPGPVGLVGSGKE